MEWIYLVLIGLVLLFGLAVLVVNRRRAQRSIARRHAPAAAPPAPPPPRRRRRRRRRAGGGARARPATLPRADGAGALGAGRRLLGIRGRRGITDETWDDLEEALLRADVGVGVTDRSARWTAHPGRRPRRSPSPTQLLDALHAEMIGRLAGADRELRFERRRRQPERVALRRRQRRRQDHDASARSPHQQREAGRTVLMAAGDTFRAAAAEQLTTWAERADAEIVRGNEGGDPSAVVFDAVERAAARGHRSRARRHGRSAAHQDQPDGGAAQGPPGRREGRRTKSPRSCSSSTPPPARTGSPRPASSATPPRSPVSC